MFDNKAAIVKNEAGGGNLSTLEQCVAVLWQREAMRCENATLRVCLCEAGHNKMDAVSSPLHQTDGR